MVSSIQRDPLFMKVRRVILEAIQSGQFAQGNLLPPEKILAQQFQVSRATVRNALQSLEDDNIIRKQHGVGTFVVPENSRLKMRIDKVKGFYQLIGDSGYEPSIRKTEMSRDLIPDRLSEILGVPRRSEALILKRTFTGDGKPAIDLCEYIPVSNLSSEPQPGEVPDSVFEFADRFCPDRIEYTITEIIPTTVSISIAEAMGLPRNQPILKLEEVHFNRTDKPMIFSEIYVNDRIIRFTVFRTRVSFI